MRLRICGFVLVTLGALCAPGFAHAAGGNYVFAGGTAREQAQVHAALNASSFNWSVVPQTITIHIAPGVDSEATPGNVWLDADLVDSGRFSWGVVQHEYAHQVDYFLLDDTKRLQLQVALGGSSWYELNGSQAHGDQAVERFASTLAWSYWQSKDNVMRPTSATDESAALPPAAFQALLARVLGVPATTMSTKQLSRR